MLRRRRSYSQSLPAQSDAHVAVHSQRRLATARILFKRVAGHCDWIFWPNKSLNFAPLG